MKLKMPACALVIFCDFLANENGAPQGAAIIDSRPSASDQATAAAFTFNRHACSSGSV